MPYKSTCYDYFHNLSVETPLAEAFGVAHLTVYYFSLILIRKSLIITNDYFPNEENPNLEIFC